MKASCSTGIAAVLLLIVGTAVAQSPSRVKLPIAEGVWVDTQTRCNAATEAHVHADGKFGHLYFAEAGAGRTPYDDVIPLLGVVNRKDGFTGVITKFDDGVVQVKAGANGQAIIRATSPSEGEVWRETVRLCAPDSLSTKMRAAVVPFFPNTAAQSKAVPATVTARINKLPIKDGLWADMRKGGCKRLGERRGYEDPAFIIDQTYHRDMADDPEYNGAQMMFPQELAALKPVKDLGGGRYLVGKVSQSMRQHIIRIHSPTQITVEKGSVPGTYVWCSPVTRWEPWEFDPSEG